MPHGQINFEYVAPVHSAVSKPIVVTPEAILRIDRDFRRKGRTCYVRYDGDARGASWRAWHSQGVATAIAIWPGRMARCWDRRAATTSRSGRCPC